MKTVILRGPVLTQSGYGVHSRQVARWLLNKHDIDVKFHALPWGDTPWIVDPDSQDGLIGKIMNKTVDGTYRADVSLQLQLPNEWDPKVATYNVGLTAGVETDRCNSQWITCINSMNRVIVPSQHVKTCFNGSGQITVPLDVIPESYIDAVVSSNNVTLPHFTTNFNFLLFGQITGNNPFNDRKNTFFTLKWLCESFRDDKDVGIVLKTNAGRNSKIDRNLVKGMMTAVLTECRKGQYPSVHLLHGDMHDDEVAALYKHPQIKALVALTRGEGYGLPILEAAVSGLPIIATGWSGHLDFLSHGKFISVDHTLGEIHPSRVDDKIFVKGAKWATPSENDFKKRITKFRTADSTPRDWAQELSEKLRVKYSFEAISKQYDALLKDVI